MARGDSSAAITRAESPSAKAQACANNEFGHAVMMREIPRPETVGEQPVERRVVRHAQQRFRQRHHREPLARGEREFVQEVLDAADPAAPRAHQSEQFSREVLRRGGDLGAGFRRKQILRKRLVGRRIGRGEDWNILRHDGSCAIVP